MASPYSISTLPTHEVANQPPLLGDIDLFAGDLPLQEALSRYGAAWARPEIHAFGRIMGRAETYALADAANRHKPELAAFDRYGRRIDEVSFHPAYYELMRLAAAHGIPSIAWTAKEPGGHVAHVALEYLFGQVEGGVCCPMTMTYAAVPVIRRNPPIAGEWEQKLLARAYDPRLLPVAEKTAATMGMAMTEKQGGSDVRSNTTRATSAGDGWFVLKGHKWFCSAPMSDAFLTLAQADEGLTCFFVPRILPDGARNPFFIQRLKDKLGNCSNASSEIEYDGTLGLPVGEPGRGVKTILEMVHHTRLDASMAPVALMRQALLQAMHHARHRIAFQRRLIDQPLMRAVLADLAIEWEAAMALLFRVAHAYDQSAASEDAARFARIGVALAKFWLNKLAANYVYEAMECLGGIGYVEESILARLYREAPVNSIWEGSGNVICLDILRAAEREAGALDAVLAEISAARGSDARFDQASESLRQAWRDKTGSEQRARSLAERTAQLLQASLLLRHAPSAVADAFIATRIAGDHGRTYGTLPLGVDVEAILNRAWPE